MNRTTALLLVGAIVAVFATVIVPPVADVLLEARLAIGGPR